MRHFKNGVSRVSSQVVVPFPWGTLVGEELVRRLGDEFGA